jgi:hypothetical protein
LDYQRGREQADNTLSMAKDVKDVAEGLKLTKIHHVDIYSLFYQLLIYPFLGEHVITE